MTDLPDTVHHIAIEWDEEPRLRLTCSAAPGAPCRMRPADDRETWYVGDPDLVDGDCWAVEWVEAGGWESVGWQGRDIPPIPVVVDFGEGNFPIMWLAEEPDHE